MRRDQSQPLQLPTTTHSNAWTTVPGETPHKYKTLAAEKWLTKNLLSLAGNPPISITLWNGDEIHPADTTPLHRIRIADRAALLKLCANPDLQLGELYTEGRVQIDADLEGFSVTLNNALAQAGRRGRWAKLVSQFYLLKRNSLSRAKDNIHHHYDLGNPFYSLWLDQQMLYTCAYFSTKQASLEQAQIAKMDHVARKLRLQPGQQVVEAGCGWGGLALHLARHYGVTVTAYNISKQQLDFARQRASAEGLTDRVRFIEGDYREIDTNAECDAFVSIGMLEHIGVKQFRQLGAVIDRILRPNGYGLIHSIGRNRPAPMNAWIERRIFPGAYPPSPSELAAIFEPFQFSLLDLENLRLHYATTLRHWLLRFDANSDKISDMFDAAFVRAWRFYLSGSSAAFLTGELQLFQIVFSRCANNEVPLDRTHIYPVS